LDVANSFPNNNSLRALTLVVLTGFVAVCVSFGADSSLIPRTLTLAEAKRIAFESNWDLLAARKGVDVALAQRVVTKEFPNPTLAASVQKINVDNHPASTIYGNGYWDRNYDTILALNQLFEIGGKRKARQEGAKATFEQARAQLWDARRTLNQAVTKAYVAALLAEENAKNLALSAQSLRKESQIAELRFKSGDISRADKSQIEIAADRFALDAVSAESSAKAARIAVEVLMAERQPSGNWKPADSLETLAVFAFADTSDKFGAARPDVVAAEAAVRKAEADLKLQRAMRIPDPTVLAQYEHEPPDQPNTIGVGLSFPLPLWNRNRGSIKAAEATREQTKTQLEKLRDQVFAEVATAQTSYEDASARWKQYSDNIRPKSHDVLGTVEFAYRKGGASLLDLLIAERNDNDIRLEAAKALADRATAAADLAAARNISTDSTAAMKDKR
jgi:cobalt-zinc-cadmium efflux system outer membrane protein